ncbi:uncharacterized protein LOC135164878 isoform X2 [Diachasmimorpha longicaudata]|uniref:uncharacterized protein LOC135164878 isoform X2 n=1 Tax=Diachasmimorpha longicaudata TaxID=58733 RepID=UPI0030B90B5E
MADDPNRDILPVKQGSCADTCRSTWVAGLMVNPRERHAVCKLDRYELEDRYLCLLDEAQALKKLANTQEDKLKRLTTRLMRISASSRPCIAAALTIDSDKVKIEELERENSKFKDRIFVLKNQLMSHKGLKRSPPRRCINWVSSRPTTCRSEDARTKISTSTNYGDGKGNLHSQNVKMEELQQQRQGMMSRISELEDELINCQTELQKTKVDESIEYIRMVREMKQQEEKLTSSHSVNTSLEEKIRVLKQQLQETSSKNGQISAALFAEKDRLTKLDETLSKSQNSQLALREKEDRIRDLMSEIKILQHNNSELISLSTNNSEVELENIELRRKISEQQVDNHNLKSAVNNEQANITALQAVNTQLMGKLQEMQRDMDTLTVQLKSLQNQTEKPKKPDERKTVPTHDKTTITSPRSRRSSKEESDYSFKGPRKLPQVSEKVEASVQTEQIEISPRAFCSAESLNASDQIRNSPPRNHGKPVETIAGANLSRDEILKLLDQAQINVPLESHNAAKMRQFEGFSPVHKQRDQSCNCSCESFDISDDSHPQHLIQCLRDIMKECNNIIIARVRDKPSEFIDQNNNTKIQTSRPKKTENCDLSTSDTCGEFTEEECCSCDTRKRPFTSAIDDIQISLEEMIDIMQRQRERIKVRRYEVHPKIKNKVDYRRRSLKYTSPCRVPVHRVNSSCPMIVTDQQALVEIHISSLQLSPFGMHHLFDDFRMSPSLFIGCDFCGQESVFSPSKTYPTLTFNSSCVYRVPRISKFLNCVLQDYIYLQLYIVPPYPDRPYPVAHGKMSVKDILDYPQNKLHYIVNMECTSPCYLNATFGQIFFWIRLSCDVDRVRAFKQERELLETSQSSQTEKIKREEIASKGQTHRRSEGKKENKWSRWSPQELGSPDSSSEILQTIHQPRKRDTHFESTTRSFQYEPPTTSASEKQDPIVRYEESRGDTLQKRANSWRAWSLGDHPIKRDEIREAIQLNQMTNGGFHDTENLFDETNTVLTDNWGRYKRKSLNSQVRETSEAVVIRIERLNLFPRCRLLKDGDIKQLYVEFSFLGNFGLDLETVAVPIPKNPPYQLFFNYMKKFDIDEKSHSDQRKKLEEMLSDEVNSTVKFTIVHEPLMEEMETKDCIEVGHAYLNLKEHVLTGGHHDISLLVSNTEGSDTIGTLKVTLLGADAIRSCLPQT